MIREGPAVDPSISVEGWELRNQSDATRNAVDSGCRVLYTLGDIGSGSVSGRCTVR